MQEREAELIRIADEALERADHQRALEALADLERANPADGNHAKRSADVYRRLHQKHEEIAALHRAADRYALCGDVMRAIVMCKRIMDLDPASRDVRARLAQLHPRLQGAGHPRPRVPAAPIQAEIDDDAPISMMPIAEVLGLEESEELSALPIFSELEVGDAVDALADTVSLAPIEVMGTFPLTPFFAALRQDSFERLIRKLTVRNLEAGDLVFRQGDLGRSFFVITDGTIELYADRQLLSRLDAGEFFGEIALITDHPRMASARAAARSVLVEIDRRAIGELIYEDPEVMTILLWFLRDRLVDSLVRTSELFAHFPYARRRVLADRFQFIESKKPVTLIEQGAPPRGLVIILAGRASVIRTYDGEDLDLAQLGPGDVCGEMSLLTGEPAVASVRSLDHIFALEISVADFRSLVAEHPEILVSLEDIAERRREALVQKIEAQMYSEGRLPLF
jgi:CRP-like cAMP-binding protein